MQVQVRNNFSLPRLGVQSSAIYTFPNVQMWNDRQLDFDMDFHLQNWNIVFCVNYKHDNDNDNDNDNVNVNVNDNDNECNVLHVGLKKMAKTSDPLL